MISISKNLEIFSLHRTHWNWLAFYLARSNCFRSVSEKRVSDGYKGCDRISCVRTHKFHGVNYVGCLNPFPVVFSPFYSVYLLSIWLHGKSILHNAYSTHLWTHRSKVYSFCLLHVQHFRETEKGSHRVSRSNRANCIEKLKEICNVQFNPFIKFTINPGNFWWKECKKVFVNT